MKTGQFRLILILIIALLLLTAFFSGCGAVKNSDTVWFIDPNGQFHTNDIKLAQREIPFTITLPSYLPNNIDPNQVRIVGPFDESYEPYWNGIRIEISYVNGDSRIYIDEKNVSLVMEPNNEAKPVYHDIVGIRVLQQTAQLAGSSGITEGLAYDWNYDKLTFSVQTFSISEEETFKIVESMVKQLKQ
jgi:hypothetical protein